MTAHGFLLLYATLLGLLVGSYLNVLIYRLPRGISTVLPASRCPHCRARIRPWHNVPLAGYLILGGRCRSCHAPIHWRYPLVEALSGGAFAASFAAFGASLEAAVAAAFCAAMIVLAAIDLEHHRLPDRITLPGLVLGLALSPWLAWSGFRAAVLGAALGAALLSAASALWFLLRGVPGVGLGDVKMLAMVGAVLGWPGVVVTLAGASALGGLVGLAGLLLGRLGMQSRLPFGAFMAPAAIAALFFGPQLLAAYGALAPAIDPGFR